MLIKVPSLEVCIRLLSSIERHISKMYEIENGKHFKIVSVVYQLSCKLICVGLLI